MHPARRAEGRIQVARRVVDPKGAHVVFRLSGVLGETQASYALLEEIRRDIGTLPPKIVFNLLFRPC